MKIGTAIWLSTAALGATGAAVAAGAGECDRICLVAIGDQYRAACLAHDPAQAPISRRVRFVENNVEMSFPDATWDTAAILNRPRRSVWGRGGSVDIAI